MMKKRNFLLAVIAVMGFSLAAGCGMPLASGGQASPDSTQAQSGVAPKYESQESQPGSGDGSAAAPVESDANAQTVPASQTAELAVTEDEAKAIALGDAGVGEADVTRLRVKTDRDDGRRHYEVGFCVDDQEYEYEIDCDTGKIISMDCDRRDSGHHSSRGSGQANSQDSLISEDEAVQIVLDRIDGASASDVWIELDYDDGWAYYEGDVYYDQMEYEFEMDAYTGDILEWSEELYGR